MRALALLGAVNAFLAVALGAFAAHGLKKRLTAEMLGIFEIGVRYHFYHALGLFAAAWLAGRGGAGSGAASVGGWLMVAGIIVFSGSLYVLSVTGTRWLGAVTPLGGLAFLAGWTCLAIAAWKIR